MHDIGQGFNLEKDMDKTASVTLSITISGFLARSGLEIDTDVGLYPIDDYDDYWECVAWQYGFDSYEQMCEKLEDEGIFLNKDYREHYEVREYKVEKIEAMSIKDLENQVKGIMKEHNALILDEINDLQNLNRKELRYENVFPVKVHSHFDSTGIYTDMDFFTDELYEYRGLLAYDDIVYKYQVGGPNYLEDADLFRVEISCRIPELLVWKEKVSEKDLAEEKEEAPITEIKTNMGTMPIEDYREVLASRSGFGSYDEIFDDYLCFSNGDDKERKPEEANVTVAKVGKKDCFRENIMAEEKAKEKGNRNEKLEQMEQIIQDIADGWDKNPALMAEALEFGEKFHNYSVKNQMLIYAQNPHAQYVASFNKWNELGSKITKGEHGLKVFVPVKATYLETIDEVTGEPALVPLRYATAQQKKAYKEGEIKGHEKMRFKAGTVFDISQTDFPKEKYPELFNMGYSKEESRQIVEGMIDFSEVKLDCPVDIKDLSSITLRGCYYPGYNRIHLNEKMEDTAKMSTLSHELGHAMIHREYSEKSTHRKEFEADAVSIVGQL